MRKANSGFTLIEVLTATLILSGTILGFVRIMGDNLMITQQAERHMVATLLAEGEVERVKAALFNDFTADVSGWSDDLSNGYYGSRSVTSVSTYLKDIEVSVGYDTDGDSGLDSEEIQVTLNTQYAERQ